MRDPYKMERAAIHALEAKNIVAVERLITQGLDVNMLIHSEYDDGMVYQPLFHCLLDDFDREIARLLLENGVDINVRSAQGRTPLMRAVINKNADAVTFLLENNANVFLKDKDGKTVLEIAKNLPRVSAEIIQHLENAEKREKQKKRGWWDQPAKPTKILKP